MAPVRVLKPGLREAFKKTVANVGLSDSSGARKLHQGSSLSKKSSHSQAVHETFTTSGTKKFQSRRRRANRFGDHGSSSAFKKVVRRRDRAKITVLGLPLFPPIPYDLQPQSPFQHQMPATEPPVSTRPADPRLTARESRFAEKHLGVPFGIYLACKSLNTPHRGPVKSVERHGRETHRERLVVLAWAKGSPFRGCKRRTAFMQPPDGFVLGAVFNGDSEDDSHSSSPSPRVGSDLEDMEFFLLPPAAKADPPVSSTELSDEMEDVVPAPLIYRQPLSQLVQSLSLVPTPTVPASPVQAMHASPPSPLSLAFQSLAVQSPFPLPSPAQIRHAQPVQPGQLLPTMSYFCRNLTRISTGMVSTLQGLGSVRIWERSALSPTTPVPFKTRPSYPSAASVWLPPPAPTKARRAYARPSALYESDG